MYLNIQKINNKILKESENYFPDSFCYNLKKDKPWTYRESLVARYIIKQNNNTYTSISHKKGLVFIWTSNKKIWIDIEILKERDKHLLSKFKREEFDLLGWKSWINFYILWTAKESIIKYLNLKLDDITDIILTNYDNISENKWWLTFSKKMKFNYKGNINLVYSWRDKEIIFSVCV